MAAPALVERAKARIGSVLREKWRLDTLLGVGGSASVYAATHRNGKRGAIKLLHPELSAQTDFVTRFLREGYVANKINHPGVVQIQDDDKTEDGTVFLIMELLEGYTLERRLRKKSALPVREALKITEELLDVVAAAHEAGVIHRDIKPANIFITREKQLKVLDFGIARLHEVTQLHQATQMGMPLGTPAFMPPEQARGRWNDVDVRTDLWAVGATLWALISGVRPRRAETANEELLLAMTEPLAALASVAPQVPPDVAKIVDRAVAFDMNTRWPNARTMQQALRLALLLEEAKSPGEPPSDLGERIASSPDFSNPWVSPAAQGREAGAAAQRLLVDPASVRPPEPRPPFPSTSPPSSSDARYGGPLSLSRYDALGERLPRVSSSATPTGDARLLTTGAPLAVASRATPAPSAPSALADVTAPRRRRGRSWFAIGIAVGLVVGGGGLFYAWKTNQGGFARPVPPPPAPQPVIDVPPPAPSPSPAPAPAPAPTAADTLELDALPTASASAAATAPPAASAKPAASSRGARSRSAADAAAASGAGDAGGS